MTVTYDINGSRIGSSVTTEGNITQEERERMKQRWQNRLLFRASLFLRYRFLCEKFPVMIPEQNLSVR